MRQHQHIGAYGLLKKDGRILLVRKTRGPYRGQLDLPGGGIAFGEDPLAALRREFREETGLVITGQTLLNATSNRVCYQTQTDETEDLHHLGLIYQVHAADPGTLKTKPDGADSGGALWVTASQIDRLAVTPFAKVALQVVAESPA